MLCNIPGPLKRASTHRGKIEKLALVVGALGHSSLSYVQFQSSVFQMPATLVNGLPMLSDLAPGTPSSDR